MIGLIFGETNFPKEILHQIKKDKIKHLIIDLTKEKNFRFNKNSHHVSIGQIGKIINILKKNNCKKVIFAGKVKKPNFLKIKIDFKGFYYLPKIMKAAKLGDAAILKVVINILAKEKIKVVRSNTYNPELTLLKGIYSKLKPNKADLVSINKGIKSLGKINPHNHTQGLIIRDSSIIAKEGTLGTKKMLEIVKNSKNLKGILIKFPKKKQDLRIDLPTVGLDTLKDCKKSRVKGIVLKSKQNIFMNKNESISFANKNKIFIMVK